MQVFLMGYIEIWLYKERKKTTEIIYPLARLMIWNTNFFSNVGIKKHGLLYYEMYFWLMKII